MTPPLIDVITLAVSITVAAQASPVRPPYIVTGAYETATSTGGKVTLQFCCPPGSLRRTGMCVPDHVRQRGYREDVFLSRTWRTHSERVWQVWEILRLARLACGGSA